jgi:hypothetical protein
MTDQPIPQDQQHAAEVKEAHAPRLMARPNVVGVGVGYKHVDGRPTPEIGVIVLVRRKTPLAGLAPGAAVPRQVDDLPTDVVEVGELRAFQGHTGRWRPAPGGVSIGHYRITAGTLGCRVRDRRTGGALILSNNHVLANSNEAAPGDPILQPGPADGGSVDADAIAVLERFIPIQYTVSTPTCSIATTVAALLNRLAKSTGSSHRLLAYRENALAVNQVDAAVARPINPNDLRDDIYEIGPFGGVAPASLNMAVRKSGRTTGLTNGVISVIEATVSVSYGSGRIATFENQLVAGPMSQGGDSGSLVLDAATPRAVGLLFAGSAQTTIFSPIQAVLDALEVDL